ncbi:MAG TPA: DUF3144 domain-containing protein [Gammaproteobacteria bacterium]|nr:DUF3144 domain-containing protein [Gammaproteobacteria bacterium]
MKDEEARFYERVDSHIQLSNDQLKGEPNRGRVNASMMSASARFSAYVAASSASSADQMAADRDKTIAYFVEQYRLMLEDHLEDHIANFSSYMEG